MRQNIHSCVLSEQLKSCLQRLCEIILTAFFLHHLLSINAGKKVPPFVASVELIFLMTFFAITLKCLHCHTACLPCIQLTSLLHHWSVQGKPKRSYRQLYVRQLCECVCFHITIHRFLFPRDIEYICCHSESVSLLINVFIF